MNWFERTVCDVLEEMRVLDKTKNYSALLSLVEEVQVMANRMEQKLGANKVYEELIADIKVLKEEKKKLKQEKGDDNNSI